MGSWLENLAHDAGKIALSYFNGSFEVIVKENNTPVTTADLAVDRFLRERILAEFPDDCVLSEETEDDPRRLEAKRVWIVDPIDGTSVFIEGRDHFAILVALTIGGGVVESVAHLPALGATMYSKQGEGCFLNGSRVRVSSRGMDEARISCCGDKTPQLDTVKARMVESYLAIIDVARGRLDGGVFEISPLAGEHDLACAVGAIGEAGGRVTDGEGEPLRFNKQVRSVPPVMVCSNGLIHDALLAKTQAIMHC